MASDKCSGTSPTRISGVRRISDDSPGHSSSESLSISFLIFVKVSCATVVPSLQSLLEAADAVATNVGDARMVFTFDSPPDRSAAVSALCSVICADAARAALRRVRPSVCRISDGSSSRTSSLVTTTLRSNRQLSIVGSPMSPFSRSSFRILSARSIVESESVTMDGFQLSLLINESPCTTFLPFHSSLRRIFRKPAARKHFRICFRRKSALDVACVGLRPRLLACEELGDFIDDSYARVDECELLDLLLLPPRPLLLPPRPLLLPPPRPRGLEWPCDLVCGSGCGRLGPGRPVIVDSGGNGGNSSSDVSDP